MKRSTKLAAKQPLKSTSGATDSLNAMSSRARAAPPRELDGAASEPSAPPRVKPDFFVPDFCQPRMVLGVVLISELLALVLTLGRLGPAPLLTELAKVSLFVQWQGLSGAAVLCYTRDWLARRTVPAASGAAFALLMTSTAALSVLSYWIGVRLAPQGSASPLFPTDLWPFLLRNEGICAIVVLVLLRYFFVAYQWRLHVKAEARSRIHALQARIQPHFLFNSMNTIAALTRSDPRRAEEAVEDLADLFRATLADSDRPLRMKEELELSRIYQRIETLRLGDRLRVEWLVGSVPMRAFVPGLTIQPLLENAICHGIEPLPEGGTVSVEGTVADGDVVLSITNPVAEFPTRSRDGNRLALDNIRQRLKLAYGDRGHLEVERDADRYRVTVRFPYEE
jgi:two-component system, LytTR family, sensor histidine kinase AlgZ